jgi:spermidine synthase
MEKSFEELDFCATPLGELILRRRKIPMLENEIVYEIILNGEFLMSSLFHVVEEALADLGLAASPATGSLDVVIGGLGLGYTAAAALKHGRVRSLRIVDFLEPVIRWHQTGLVPLGAELSTDPRTRFIEGDFFDLAMHPKHGFDLGEPERKYHAVLLDIDHTPQHWLNPRHAAFYTVEGLQRLRQHLHPGGVFAIWSDEPPDKKFCSKLEAIFTSVQAQVVSFPNPIRGGESSGTVYVAVSDDYPRG